MKRPNITAALFLFGLLFLGGAVLFAVTGNAESAWRWAYLGAILLVGAAVRDAVERR